MQLATVPERGQTCPLIVMVHMTWQLKAILSNIGRRQIFQDRAAWALELFVEEAIMEKRWAQRIALGCARDVMQLNF